jgi:hypothetical protein
VFELYRQEIDQAKIASLLKEGWHDVATLNALGTVDFKNVKTLQLE